MNNTDLDSFDQALLTELRQVAAEGATAPARGARRTRRRWAYAGTGVAAAAVTAFGLSSLGSPAAYAVDEQGDGDIVITIHELDDADGLEQALADHGIEADVDYSSDDMGGPVVIDGDAPDLKESWGGKHSEAELEVTDGPGTHVEQAEPGEPPADGPCGGLDDMPFETELTSDDFVITIPGDSVIRESHAVLRITTSGDVQEQMAGINVAFSIGDVDCGFGTASLGAEH